LTFRALRIEKDDGESYEAVVGEIVREQTVQPLEHAIVAVVREKTRARVCAA
jgi:predicted transcriptional regulator